eukprot:6214763-Pleurochrysis_carterae.AAC.3
MVSGVEFRPSYVLAKLAAPFGRTPWQRRMSRSGASIGWPQRRRARVGHASLLASGSQHCASCARSELRQPLARTAAKPSPPPLAAEASHLDVAASVALRRHRRDLLAAAAPRPLHGQGGASCLSECCRGDAPARGFLHAQDGRDGRAQSTRGDEAPRVTLNPDGAEILHDAALSSDDLNTRGSLTTPDSSARVAADGSTHQEHSDDEEKQPAQYRNGVSKADPWWRGKPKTCHLSWWKILRVLPGGPDPPYAERPALDCLAKPNEPVSHAVHQS